MSKIVLVNLMALFLAVIICGCGDSEDFVETSTSQNFGNLQVQVDPDDVAAQASSTPAYELRVVNQQNNTRGYEIFQIPPAVPEPSDYLWRVNALPVGLYGLEVTGRLDGVPFIKYSAADVPVLTGQTTVVGHGLDSTHPFTIVPLDQAAR
jgi:hypothetical protein